MVGPGVARRHAVVALLVMSLVIGLLPPAQASDGAEAHVLARHNEARAANGLAPLSTHGDLTAVARGWARSMRDSYEAGGSRNGALRHNPSLESQIPQHYQRAGENVGYTVLTDASHTQLANRLHEAYMGSAGHRANILGDFDRVGIGVAMASDGTMWSATVFMLEGSSGGGSSSSGDGGSTEDSGSEGEGSAAPAPESEPEPEPLPEPEPVTTFTLLGDDAAEDLLRALGAARNSWLTQLLAGGARPTAELASTH